MMTTFIKKKAIFSSIRSIKLSTINKVRYRKESKSDNLGTFFVNETITGDLSFVISLKSGCHSEYTYTIFCGGGTIGDILSL